MTAWSRIKIDMQITNSVVCNASKGCIYKQIKPPLVGEHAFPLTGFVCKSAHVTLRPVLLGHQIGPRLCHSLL